MERTQRTKLASALILGLVFLAGSVVGVAVDRQITDGPAMGPSPGAVGPMASDTSAAETGEAGRERSGRGGNERSRRPMYTQIDGISEEQLARIEVIVDSAGSNQWRLRRAMDEEMDPIEDELRAVRRAWEARRDAAFDSTIAQIKAVMTPAQAEEYDSLLAERERRDRERRRGRGPSGSSKD